MSNIEQKNIHEKIINCSKQNDTKHISLLINKIQQTNNIEKPKVFSTLLTASLIAKSKGYQTMHLLIEAHLHALSKK